MPGPNRETFKKLKMKNNPIYNSNDLCKISKIKVLKVSSTRRKMLNFPLGSNVFKIGRFSNAIPYKLINMLTQSQNPNEICFNGTLFQVVIEEKYG